jgi:hypothetical protein
MTGEETMVKRTESQLGGIKGAILSCFGISAMEKHGECS